MALHRVSISETASCALQHAFLRNSKLAGAWGQVIGPFALFYEIFQSSLPLSSVLSVRTMTMFREFAMAELERLELTGSDARLLCRHGGLLHSHALRKLLVQFPVLESG